MTNTVTEKQKSIIKNLRSENYSYARIAEVLTLSPNTVKSICRREGYSPEALPRKTKDEKAALQICKYCGKRIDNPWNRRGKQFCSDHCRTTYWNEQKLISCGAAKVKSDEPALSPEGGQNDPGLPGPKELSSEVRR